MPLFSAAGYKSENKLNFVLLRDDLIARSVSSTVEASGWLLLIKSKCKAVRSVCVCVCTHTAHTHTHTHTHTHSLTHSL